MKYCVIVRDTRIGDFETSEGAEKAKEIIHESWHPVIVKLTDTVPEELTKHAPMAMKFVVRQERWFDKLFRKIFKQKKKAVWLPTNSVFD